MEYVWHHSAYVAVFIQIPSIWGTTAFYVAVSFAIFLAMLRPDAYAMARRGAPIITDL
ncbi:protein of unknown function (plasmid) [Cupriavidus taiwanensis]|uniref:Uncharacterized protein n=1 Tax=Cupriavidus taiwanensis TaxID=164546 RepID=A0A9Q7V122_9BURK|nr:protein of unknown function [Cupriavidus taiwanensis]